MSGEVIRVTEIDAYRRDRAWKIAQLAAILTAGRMNPQGGTLIDEDAIVFDAAVLLKAAEQHVLNDE